MAEENEITTAETEESAVSSKRGVKEGQGLRFVKSKGVCRKCRRIGVKLFLKGEKCNSSKCPFMRRSYAPGQHGEKRSKLSDYGRHLQEKQKLLLIYKLKDRQLRKIIREAGQKKGSTEEEIVKYLERRLDNVIYKAGWALSMAQARKLVVAGHFYINGRKVNRPSYLVKKGDKIVLKERSKNLKLFKEIIFPATKEKEVPSWIKVEKDKIEVLRLPKKSDTQLNIDFSLVIEFYKK